MIISAAPKLFEITAAQFLTVRDVATLFKVPEKTVRNWVYKGDLKPIKLGRLIRFKKEDIELWISKQNGGIHGY